MLNEKVKNLVKPDLMVLCRDVGCTPLRMTTTVTWVAVLNSAGIGP